LKYHLISSERAGGERNEEENFRIIVDIKIDGDEMKFSLILQEELKSMRHGGIGWDEKEGVMSLDENNNVFAYRLA
jgi:hypothetical protein